MQYLLEASFSRKVLKLQLDAIPNARNPRGKSVCPNGFRRRTGVTIAKKVLHGKGKLAVTARRMGLPIVDDNRGDLPVGLFWLPYGEPPSRWLLSCTPLPTAAGTAALHIAGTAALHADATSASLPWWRCRQLGKRGKRVKRGGVAATR